MTDIEFQACLSRIVEEIETLPRPEREKLLAICDETRRRNEALRTTVNALQESLDSLRVGVSYLVFDLEATRRENQALKDQLGQAE